MTFSVLLCTYNRPPALLRAAIRSILACAPDGPDELIVVNGGDGVADGVVEEYQATAESAGVALKLVKTVNVNLAANRNVGLAHCVGDIVAMTDDDAEVFPDWVAQMKRVHEEHPGAGAVGGQVIGTNVDALVGRVADAITFPFWSTPCSVRTLPGVNVSYKRAALEAVGPQDETLFRGEDVDFNWRVILAGFTIQFDPTIRVYHFHRPTLRAFLHQHYMYGRAYYLVRRKWPEMYCLYPRHMRRPKDMLKAINFVASILYQPLLSASKIPGAFYRLAAIPVLALIGITWRRGVLHEWLAQRRAHSSRA